MRSHLFASGVVAGVVAASALSAAPLPSVVELPAPAPITMVGEGGYDAIELSTPAGMESTAVAISDSGTHVGGWYYNPTTNAYTPVRWGNLGTAVFIPAGCSTGGGVYAFGPMETAVATCRTGTSAVGGVTYPGLIYAWNHGVRYVGTSSVFRAWGTGPGTPPYVGNVYGIIYAINRSNVAVGVVENLSGTGVARAAQWAPNGVLGTLPGRGTSPSSRAFAINDAGTVVGRVGFGGAADERAAMWRAGVLTELGSLGGRSGATAINAGGVIVGWSFDAAGDLHAFIHRGGQMVDLNVLVHRPLTRTARGTWVLGDEWIIHEAYAINDRGVIVGRGTKDGKVRAVMLRPRSGGVAISVASLQQLVTAVRPTRNLSDVMAPTLTDADRARFQQQAAAAASAR